MPQSQGLTSLKDKSPLAEIQAEKVPQDRQAEINRQKTEQEITFLQRRKKQLTSEIDTLTQSLQYQRQRQAQDTDIGKLTKQKRILLGQIKELVQSLNILKGSQDKILEAFGKFGQERIAVLDGVARSLSLEVAKETTLLNKKSADLTAWDRFLVDFADYFTQLAQICEAESLLVALERVNLEKEGKALAFQEESLKLTHNKTQELLSKAEALVWRADQRYQDADKIAKTHEKEYSQFLEECQIQYKNLELLKKSLLADRRAIKVIESDLLKRHRKLESERKQLEAIKHDIIK